MKSLIVAVCLLLSVVGCSASPHPTALPPLTEVKDLTPAQVCEYHRQGETPDALVAQMQKIDPSVPLADDQKSVADVLANCDKFAGQK